MRFSIASAIAFAAYVAAQSSVVQFNSVPSTAQAGQPFTVTFTSTSPVNIILRKGASNNLMTISTVGTSVSGGSYTFTPDTTLAPGSDYALEITQGSEINYSQQFTISGGSGSTATSAQSSMPSSTTMMSSATTVTATNGTATSAMVTAAPSAGVYPMGNGTSPAYGTGAAPYPVASGTGARMPSASNNMTMMTMPTSSSYNMPTSGSGSSGSTASARPSSGAAQVGSSLALIVGAIAAFAYIN